MPLRESCFVGISKQPRIDFKTYFSKNSLEPGAVVYACNLSSQETRQECAFLSCLG